MKRRFIPILLGGVISLISVFPAFAGNWVSNSQGWKYQNDDGSYKKAEWFKDTNEKWYYLDNDGMIVTGWLEKDGKWYFMSQQGDMLTDTYTPKGFYLGTDGAWIPDDMIGH